MRIVFSRKGVDSAAGRCASAILDGRPISLPIPTRQPTTTHYGELAPRVASLAHDLSRGRLHAEAACHLDPDIDQGALARPRPAGWRGAFGQVGAALSHLRNQGVGPGDLFLFWGLFRPVRHEGNRWITAGPAHHALFGWLEVDEVIDLGAGSERVLERHAWLVDHPHVRAGWGPSNSLFVAPERSRLLDGLPGAGTFARSVPLTAPDAKSLCDWRVPAWLDTCVGGVGMTYHPPARWRGGGRLFAAPRGQEFVADIRDREDAREWLRRVVGKAA